MQSEHTGKSLPKYDNEILKALSRFGYPLPKELVQAVIKIESGGIPGLVNPKSGASGLGQVMPIVLKDYNKRTGSSLTMADMHGKDRRSIQNQIFVSVWVLGVFWKGAYNYLVSRVEDVPIDELLKIADLFYVAGPGATKKRLDTLTVPSFDNLQSRFPKWNAFRHTKRLLKNIPESTPWQLSDISEWLHSKGLFEKMKREPKLAGVIALVALAIGAQYFFGGKNGKEKR